MKTIGKITTAIVMLALIVCTAVNTAVNIKNGSFKDLIDKNEPSIEQPAEQTSAE